MIYNKLLSNKLEANLGYSLYSCIYGSISIEADDLKKINNFAEIYQKPQKSKRKYHLDCRVVFFVSIRPDDLSIRPKVLIVQKECVKVKMEKGNDVVMRNTEMFILL